MLRPFLDGGEKKPYFRDDGGGQSALNVRGLDTVVIDDVSLLHVIDRGRNVLTQEHLGANGLCRWRPVVHDRGRGGRVFILSDRNRLLQPSGRRAGVSARGRFGARRDQGRGAGVRAD